MTVAGNENALTSIKDASTVHFFGGRGEQQTSSAACVGIRKIASAEDDYLETVSSTSIITQTTIAPLSLSGTRTVREQTAFVRAYVLHFGTDCYNRSQT
jgi:hypothetical protein